MIIEVCGPPGAGKTTLACTLTTRLRERGVAARLVASYRPSELRFIFDVERTTAVGIPDPLLRLARPARELLAGLRRVAEGWPEMVTAELLLRSLPPRSVLWAFRLRQYIWRLSRVWFSVSDGNRVVIFDQAFVQLICSLALLSESAEDEVVAHVLNLVPKPDILVRVEAPRESLRARLTERRCGQSWIERHLELDLNKSLESIEIFDRLRPLLEQHGRSTIDLDTTLPHALDVALGRLEQNILAELTAKAA